MKKYSYPWLFTMTLLFLAVIFGFIIWHREIYANTFLTRTAVRYTILSAMALAVVVSLFLVKRGAVESGYFVDYFKLYAATSLALTLLLSIGTFTLAYYLPGETSSYAAKYTYASGSSKSCSGARVYDPDLREKIKICYPAGHYASDNIIFVLKKSNALGAVVIYAMTAPDAATNSIPKLLPFRPN